MSVKKYGTWVLGIGLSVLLITVSVTGQSGRDPNGNVGPVTVGLAGDADAVSIAPQSFGIQDEAITTVQGFAFQPRQSGTTYDGTVQSGRWVTGGDSFLYAPFPELPNGVDLTQIVFYIQDTHATANFLGRLCRHWADSGVGGDVGFDCPLSISSAGTGNLIVFDDPNVVLNKRFDIDTDGTLEVVSYTLSGSWGTSTGAEIRLHSVRILWRRQVSPAPVAATFADVPVGSPIRPFVEALAASGITSGCGGGNYCPDAPLTRGQMAVFLSAALGLHWPAF